jgi:hypothetical protein
LRRRWIERLLRPRRARRSFDQLRRAAEDFEERDPAKHQPAAQQATLVMVVTAQGVPFGVSEGDHDRVLGD